jgi:hypothetical protein
MMRPSERGVCRDEFGGFAGRPGDAGMPGDLGGNMAARRKKAAKGSSGDLIISKSRTKAAVRKCNVGGEFYGALDKAVREMIKSAEGRALGNKRKTLKAVDL